MYLPVILIDRFGWAGFIVFAIPNVLGCAAFGYVISRPSRSQLLVSSHAPAMTWFSIITIAYHMFFIVWLFAELMPVFGEMMWLPIVAAAIVLALGTVWSFLPNRDWLWLSAIVYAISLAALFSVGLEPLRLIEWRGSQPLSHLAWLAPTIFFGFALCPYLDLTFHRALQYGGAGGRHSFAIFGIAFFIMILLTCSLWIGGYDKGMLIRIGLAHVLAQSVFTVGAHLREVRLSPALRADLRRTVAMTAPIAGAAVLYIAWSFAEGRWVGQAMYLRFLVFYGLVFPGYVLVFMTFSNRGSRSEPAAVRRRPAAKILFAIAVFASLPLYEWGFLHDRPWLLPIPLAGLLILRWVFPMLSRRPGPSGAAGRSEP